MGADFVIEDFKRLRRNSLLGFAKVRLPSGMVLFDVAIHQTNDVLWASPAAKPMLGRDGVQMRNSSNQLQWSPIVGFKDKHTRDRFSNGVIDALKASHPDALRQAQQETEGAS